MSNNTTIETNAITALPLKGNVIAVNWYKTILKPASERIKAKPHLLAINILADIVYWYRNTVIRDEETSEIIEIRKKFKSDLLQRNYGAIVDMFGCSDKDAREAIFFLESLGLIKRVFRNVQVGTIMQSNIMFIKVFPKIIEKATTMNNYDEFSKYVSENKEGEVSLNSDIPLPELRDTLSPNSGTPSPRTQGHPLPELRDYTYITNTYSTTNNTTENKGEGTAEQPTPPVEVDNVSTQNKSLFNEKENTGKHNKKEVATENVVTNEKIVTIENIATISNSEDIEFKLQTDLQERLRKSILSSQQGNEMYLMKYKSKVSDATVADVNMLADKVASDFIIQTMKAEYIDNIEKVVEYVNKNENRVKTALKAKMGQYVSTQNKRISQTTSHLHIEKPNIVVTTKTIPPTINVKGIDSDGYVDDVYYPILDSESPSFDERAHYESPNYSPLFDPTSVGFVEDSERRELLYRTNKSMNNGFYTRK